MPVLDPAAWLSALAVFASAYLAGSLVCLRFRLDDAVDAVLLRFVLGLALLPLAVLLAGQFQGLLFLRPLWLVPAAAGAALFAADLARGLRGQSIWLLGGWHDPWRRLAALPWAAWMAYVLAPLSCPPLNYDVLEYHLGVVPHFFETGRIEPIPHVFYSAQPIATEMLYTLGSVFEGTAWAAATGRIQWGLVLLAGLLLWRAAERSGVPRTIALLLPFGFLTHPIILRLELDRMTDLTGAMFLLGGWLVWSHLGAEHAPRRLACGIVLMGVLAGAAISSKWTNAATAALGIGMGPAVGLLLQRREHAGKAGGLARMWFLHAAMFIAAASLVLLPWISWVWRQTGNPIAPFGASLFPTERWGAAQLNYLLETHRPLAMGGAAYWQRLGERIVSPTVGLWPLFFALALGLLGRLARRRAGEADQRPGSDMTLRNVLLSGLLAFALGLLLWGRLRHSAERFLAPLIAMEFLMLGAAIAWAIEGRAPSWRRAAWAALFLVVTAAAWTSPVSPLAGAAIYLDHALGESEEAEFLGRGLGATTEFFDAVNALPGESRVMVIGEARRYALRRRVTLASVFDRHPIAGFVERSGDPAGLRSSLRTAGYTHLAVNEYETARLLDFHPPPALEADPAFMRIRASRDYAELVRSYAGHSEFGAEPLSPADRKKYVAFLAEMKLSTSFRSGRPEGPSFWLAPL